MHLYIGEEAVAVGVSAQLGDRDYATSTHRGHGHFLAKGGDLNAMMAEIWGKREGICRGMGGSMHVADISKGILGANGIVGAGLAIATGAAFGAKLDGDGKVAVWQAAAEAVGRARAGGGWRPRARAGEPVRFVREGPRAGTRVIYTRGPDNLIVELMEPPGSKPDQPAATDVKIIRLEPFS